MPGWKARLNIKQYMDEVEDAEYPTDEEVHKVAGNILGAINKFIATKGGDMRSLESIRDLFEPLSTAGGSTGEELIEEFNYALTEFYDWADEKRV